MANQYLIKQVYSSTSMPLVEEFELSERNLYDADLILSENIFGSSSRNGWVTTIVNENTRCITANGDVFIVTQVNR